MSWLPLTTTDTTPASAARPRPRRRWFHTTGQPTLHAVEFRVRTGAPTVIGLPFTAGHTRQVIPFADRVARTGWNALALDPPGHGRSEGDRGRFTVPGLMQAIERVVRTVRDERPHSPILLAGCSWGGDVALHYLEWQAERRAEGVPMPRVAGVLAHAVLAPWLRLLAQRERPILRLLQERSGAAAWLAMQALGHRVPRSLLYDERQVYLADGLRERFRRDRHVLRSYDARSLFAYFRSTPPRHFDDYPPVLITAGAEDRLVSAGHTRRVARWLAEYHALTDYRELPGMGHAPFEEQPERFAQVLREWVFDALGDLDDAPIETGGTRARRLGSPRASVVPPSRVGRRSPSASLTR